MRITRQNGNEFIELLKSVELYGSVFPYFTLNSEDENSDNRTLGKFISNILWMRVYRVTPKH